MACSSTGTSAAVDPLPMAPLPSDDEDDERDDQDSHDEHNKKRVTGLDGVMKAVNRCINAYVSVERSPAAEGDCLNLKINTRSIYMYPVKYPVTYNCIFCSSCDEAEATSH